MSIHFQHGPVYLYFGCRCYSIILFYMDNNIFQPSILQILLFFSFTEVTIKQLKERVRQAEESLEQTVKVCQFFLFLHFWFW